MRTSKLAWLLGTLSSLVAPTFAKEEKWPVLNDGLTDVVQWDHYSYYVNGQRLFIFSGEFHPWRFPVPELWRDLLEKIKAAGFNTFSIYTSWEYHSASPDVLDFTNGAHNFTTIFALAKELGLYVIMRPGPYVNAETNAGGFPLWLTTGAYGALRNDDDRYTAAWKPYWETISGLIKPHLITNGGNVIIFQVENELDGQWTNIEERVLNPTIADYMQLLEDSARDSGIDVPLSYNAPNMNGFSWSKDFSNATGNVDVVGLDSYPSCWSCNLSECTGTNGEYVAYKTVEYYTYFTIQSPRQPNFMPEFQGGSYNPWGGPQGGCPNDIGADFANLFYRDLIAQRVTAISLYMMFGGTNWGHSACPVVATSYDYSSPVSEDRALWSKYYETKLLTLFTRVAHDLPYTDRVYNGTKLTTNTAITTSELRNYGNNAAFYVVRHNDSTSDSTENFHLDVKTSEGTLTIPQYANPITIDGHQSKILVTDFTFGKKKLIYSTAEVLSYSVIDGKEVLALWLPEGEAGEFLVKGSRTLKFSGSSGNTTAKVHRSAAGVLVSYVQSEGMSVVELSDGARILLLDRDTAYQFWVPTLDNNPMVSPEDTIMVQGPYLVRSAAYDKRKRVLNINGDEEDSVIATVFASKDLHAITWNGKTLPIKSHNDGMYVVSIQGPSGFELPSLGPWKWTNGLPEIADDYEPTSAAWIIANNTETPNPTKPEDNNPVLYVDDYKIHYGNHVYRATFPSTETPPTGIFLEVQGGLAFGYSVWINSEYVGSYYGLSYVEVNSGNMSFHNATLRKDSDNVMVVLMDQSGHDLRDAAIEPRGILNATLLGEGDYKFTEWRIAGNAGFEDNIDPIRGPMNEGGLYPERVGMHLPGYPEKHWNDSSDNATTLIVPSAGVRVFRTVAPLDIPSGIDVSISFRLTATSDNTFTPSNEAYTNRLRALLFVNGYQYGRFSPYIGNQIKYPVPPGVLNYNGDNTIVMTVWSQAAEGVEMEVDWVVNYVHSTSFDIGFDGSYLRPGWTEDRLQYA